ncbi:MULTISPECIES: FAD binding domain-containing protein [unclassified Roseitalea]|uniref:FAD binding domain-containing protein n=1 Tax=unclassified Roseitalea TaxID=2639107 RepID=UPI00273F1A20|nr:MULTISPECIES: FAD binding domain-containing protein [unclassified Roseitalea]
MIEVETFPTLAEAARAMGAGAAYLGGGTVMMRAVNAGDAPARLVRTTDPALTQIRAMGDTLTLGAGVTMAQILAERDLDFLHDVARQIGGPQVRNMGTVGGNIFAPHPYGDFAVALLALGARVAMADGSSARPIEDVLRERDRPSGLIASVEVPRPRPGAFAFRKVSRVRPKGASIMSIAANLPREGGRVRGARLAWGAMGPRPLRGAAVERVLEGQSVDHGDIDRAAQIAAKGLEPPTDPLASSWYRTAVAGVHLKRLLQSMEGR